MTCHSSGLDVGTTGVKAVAITPEGRWSPPRSARYPLSTPQPGWSEQDPEDWWRATEAALAELGGGACRSASGSRGRCTGSSALDERGPRRASGDPLERPADRRRVRGDRGAHRPRAPDRADREPRAPRLYRAEAPVAPAPRARRLRAASTGSCCRRTTSGCGSRASTRSTWRTRPERSSSTSPAGAGATRCSTRSRSRASGCRRCSSRRPCPGSRETEIPSRRAPGTARPPASASASTVRARSRSSSGPRASSSPRFPRTAPDDRARAHVFCHAVPGTWHAMGVMLSAAGSLQWLHDTIAPGVPFEALVAEAERLAARSRRPPVPALPPGRADAACRSGRARRVRRAPAPTRSRRARARRARGRRLRAARLARPRARPRDRRLERARVSGGGARSELLAADLRLGARRPDRADGRRRGVGVRRRAARRASPAESSPTSARRSQQPCARRTSSSPTRRGRRCTPSSCRATARLYPALRDVDGVTVER